MRANNLPRVNRIRKRDGHTSSALTTMPPRQYQNTCFIVFHDGGAYCARCGFLIAAPSGDVKRNYASDVVMATRQVLVTAAYTPLFAVTSATRCLTPRQSPPSPQLVLSSCLSK